MTVDAHGGWKQGYIHGDVLETFRLPASIPDAPLLFIASDTEAWRRACRERAVLLITNLVLHLEPKRHMGPERPPMLLHDTRLVAYMRANDRFCWMKGALYSPASRRANI